MSEEIALAAADLDTARRLHAENAELRRALDVALNELDQLRPIVRALGWCVRPGRCMVCGCTDRHGCAAGCSWVDEWRVLCSRCARNMAVYVLATLKGNHQ